jgi:hypothetical protein
LTRRGISNYSAGDPRFAYNRQRIYKARRRRGDKRIRVGAVRIHRKDEDPEGLFVSFHATRARRWVTQSGRKRMTVGVCVMIEGVCAHLVKGETRWRLL